MTAVKRSVGAGRIRAGDRDRLTTDPREKARRRRRRAGMEG
ncbi:hypothetical protein [Streptomyces virginiae]